VLTDACVLLALHTPPDVPSASVIVDPIQTVVGPVITPALAEVPMLIGFVTADMPQALLMV
jgi:hypothetical protein